MTSNKKITLEKDRKKDSILKKHLVSKENISNIIKRLNEDLHSLIIDYQKFYGGIDKIEPLRKREEITKILRKLRSSAIGQTMEKFNLANIKAKFSLYKSQWDKYQRLIEDGKIERGSLFFSTDHLEETREDNSIKKLYGEFIKAKIKNKEGIKNLSYDKFEKYINSIIEDIRKTKNIENISLKVSSKNNKTKVIATISGKNSVK